MAVSIQDRIQHNVPLAPLTTIRLGGPAAFFVRCRTVDEIRAALQYAEQEKLKTHILSGGSNTVFADAGFDGLIIKVELEGMRFEQEGKHEIARVAAGVDWDAFVAQSVTRGLAGVECLSGIPGSVGATPVQNVGAYGQAVADTIVSVQALDRQTLKVVEFSNRECVFGYRRSRFKHEDAGRYIVAEAKYRLERGGKPAIKYPQLAEKLGSSEVNVRNVREAVLELRRSKSMVIRADDPHSRSCGSFFLNVVLTQDALGQLRTRAREAGAQGEIPAFPAGEDVKVSAAWLVEQAGFARGERRGGIGISPNHTLALVNYGGTTAELLAFANDIKKRVKKIFGIELELEPVIVVS